MGAKAQKETSTVMALVPSVVEVKRSRNPEYEKAMAEVVKYVNDAERNGNDEIEFCVDHKAKVVVCRRMGIYHSNDELNGVKAPFYGISKCCPNDRFNVILGKYIALKRARGRNIPQSIRSIIFGK